MHRWKNLDAEILEEFGDASHARGHVRRADQQAATAKRSYDFGELRGARAGDLRTSKRARDAEKREFERYYQRKWRQRLKATDPKRYAEYIAKRRGTREQERARGRRYRLRHKHEARYKAWLRAKYARRYERVKSDPAYVAANRARAAAAYARLRDDPERYARVMAERRARHKRVPPKPRPAGLPARAQAAGVPVKTVYSRLARGWSLEQALSAPPSKPAPDNLRARARAAGLRYLTVYSRVMVLGWSVERALSTPVRPRRERRCA